MTGRATQAIRVAVLLVFAVALVAVPALGMNGRSAHGLRVSVRHNDQRALLKHGVAVRLHSPFAGAVKLTMGLMRGKRTRAIVPEQTVRFDKAGLRTLHLDLTGRGRRLVKRCSPAFLTSNAELSSDTESVGGASSQRLRLNRPACSKQSGPSGGNGGSAGGGSGGNGTAVDNSPPPAQPYTGGQTFDTSNGKDPIDPSVGLYPFPNDYFTVADPSSATGRRVNFNQLGMPHNRQNAPVQVQELNRNDGFSPGSSIITKVPGMDTPQAFQNTGSVPQTNIGAYADANAPVVVIDTATNQRWPIWTELDSNPANAADRVLYARPAVNFLEGHHYVVALRNMKDSAGATIQPNDAFKVFRDNLTTTNPTMEARRPHMEQVFSDLGKAGIARSNLYLAWDFTVASRQNLTGRMLAIRNDAFSQLGDDNLADGVMQGTSPTFHVTSTTNNPNSNIAREVQGTYLVPCYMNTPGCSPVGSSFNYNPLDATNPDRVPFQTPGNMATVNFTCEIPHAAVDDPGAGPARPSLYGHGLLGSQNEVGAGNVESMAEEHDFMFCATDWYGFATTNVPNVLAILQDVSLFPLLGDESQQGMLNFLYLARLMGHPSGFTSDPAFHVDGTTTTSPSVINRNDVFYDGNSQGGILGGSLTAISPDFTRAVLGVPGMNYSTLLQRSVDFEPYAKGQFSDEICNAGGLPTCPLPPNSMLGLYDNYPNELERPLIFALMQMLWDRAEPDGYAQHMTTDPLPDTPQHQVLMHPSFGDHQVANVAAEVEARTIGAGVYQPALDPGRANGDEFWGIPSITFPRSAPYTGSAMVFWDGGPFTPTHTDGTATPPAADVPPRPTDGYGADPHSYPRSTVNARTQKSEFLRHNGFLFNPCTNGLGNPIPCYSHGYTGP